MESVTAELCPSSRAVYVNSYSRFICWVLQNHSPLIHPAFADRVGTVSGLSEKQLRARIKPLLTRKNDEPPLHFDNLDPEVFQTWLLTLRKADGSELSYSALNTHRAGLFNLYRDYGRKMDSDMENELKQFFKGIKRELAVTQARGVGNCSVADLWVLWCCGHAEKKIPPLDLLEGADMPNRDNQKRLSDIRYLMKKIEAIAAERNLLSSSQTVEEVIHVYACASSVEVPSTTASARKRRIGQLAWTSIVRLHRIADKNTRSNTRL
ncbi:Hypothetical protein PHPALM_14796 [Phytophthora palmivora]|uniref:Uncharacterized protein n=1 Tax=Phytophthora palmivora TaxID=4796 RepID=A0A2P4XTU5_9STRA|nr:Hypothetical protein PHPALM_14796 [Phytophthora palmivora]